MARDAFAGGGIQDRGRYDVRWPRLGQRGIFDALQQGGLHENVQPPLILVDARAAKAWTGEHHRDSAVCGPFDSMWTLTVQWPWPDDYGAPPEEQAGGARF